MINLHLEEMGHEEFYIKTFNDFWDNRKNKEAFEKCMTDKLIALMKDSKKENIIFIQDALRILVLLHRELKGYDVDLEKIGKDTKMLSREERVYMRRELKKYVER